MVFPGHPETQELAGLAGGFRKSRGKKTERHFNFSKLSEQVH